MIYFIAGVLISVTVTSTILGFYYWDFSYEIFEAFMTNYSGGSILLSLLCLNILLPTSVFLYRKNRNRYYNETIKEAFRLINIRELYPNSHNVDALESALEHYTYAYNNSKKVSVEQMENMKTLILKVKDDYRIS